MPRKIKTHCVHGHERTSENLLPSTGCRVCYELRNSSLRGNRTPNPKYMKKYYADHKEEQTLASKKRYENEPAFRSRAIARSRRSALKKLGWTPESVETAKHEQNNRCAMCNDVFETTPHADHNHETKTSRGLLCGTCNQAIGLLQDNPTLCEAAAAYLRKWGK